MRPGACTDGLHPLDPSLMLWISRNYKSAVHDASHSPAELSGGVAVKCQAQVEKNNEGGEEGGGWGFFPN